LAGARTVPKLPGRGLAQHPMLYSGEGHNTIFLINRGKVIRTYSPQGRGEIDDVWMLGNGHVLFARQYGVEEVTPRKEIVWHYDPPQGTEIHNCQPIGLDKVLLVQNGLSPKLTIVNKAAGVIEVERALSAESLTDAKNRASSVPPHPHDGAGNLSPTVPQNERVVEYDKDFNPIRTYETSTPWAAVRLHNGNIESPNNRETWNDSGPEFAWWQSFH
jgi:hypothetical protein